MSLTEASDVCVPTNRKYEGDTNLDTDVTQMRPEFLFIVLSIVNPD